MKYILTLIPLVLALSASAASAQQGPRRGDGQQRGQAQQQQCGCDCHLQGQQQGRSQQQAQRGQRGGQQQGQALRGQRGQRGGQQQGQAQRGPRGNRQRPDRAQMLKDFDQDGDGVLNQAERTAARSVRMHQMRRSQQQGQGRAQNFDRAERRAAMLKHFDLDGDGVLNNAERAKLREEMRARRQGQGQPSRRGNIQGVTPSSSEGIEIL